MDVRGSEHWLRRLVNEHPQFLNERIRASFTWASDELITWASPISTDGYAEYRDQCFLDRLAIETRFVDLSAFWPRRGPRWDGLGTTSKGRQLLVEAKAHIREAVSKPCAANPKSLAQIHRSLNQLKAFLRSASPHDWSTLFYQYTNRLAHLYFLRELNGIDAYLAFIFFVGAGDVCEPASEAEWRGAIRVLECALGLGRRHRLAPYIAHVFVDVAQLTSE